MEMAVDLMVIPRSFSSSRVSVNRTSPAFALAIIPALETRESVRVDFPWSTLAEGIRWVYASKMNGAAHHER